MDESQIKIKPFIKWAGGKTQLIEQIRQNFPNELKIGKIKNYYEPFLGGGACFLMLSNEFQFDRICLSDINHELILTYLVVQRDVDLLIDFITEYKNRYSSLTEKKKEEYYYEMRNAYNLNRFSINYKRYNQNWIPRAAQLIFLNKTCFNGLFRINQKGDFNVPFGKRYNPNVFDSNNLIEIAKLLGRSEIETSDFSSISNKELSDSFVFLDPPYRPLFNDSNFTSYTKGDFKEIDQIRLAKLINDIDNRGAKIMLTNSDPENKTKHDDFFFKHYSKFNIRKISTSRMINNNFGKRKLITDLLITNY